MSAPTNAIEVFAIVERDLEGHPTSKRLREILDIFDDPAYVTELVRNLQVINDPSVLGALLARLRRLQRNLEEARERRKHNKEMLVRIGVGGGVGLVGGSIVAAAAATFPPIVLIPVLGGAWMAFTGYRAASKLDEERHLYEILAEQMSQILKRCGDVP